MHTNRSIIAIICTAACAALIACGDASDGPPDAPAQAVTRDIFTGAVTSDGACEDYLGRTCQAGASCAPFEMARYRPDRVCYERVVVACLPEGSVGCTNAVFRGIDTDGSCWSASAMCAPAPEGVQGTGYDDPRCAPPEGVEVGLCAQ